MYNNEDDYDPHRDKLTRHEKFLLTVLISALLVGVSIGALISFVIISYVVN